MYKRKIFSVVLSEQLNKSLIKHLIRKDKQEDLTFAFWIPSKGKHRLTAILKQIALPEENDRNLHGNVSYNYKYLLRVCKIAIENNYGIAIIHSHIGPGWQDMSRDDINTEMNTFINVETLTNQSLVGLTIGSDGYWSARIWNYNKNCQPEFEWAGSVRVTGLKLKSYFNDYLIPQQRPNNKTIRTVNIWGDETHKEISRLNIGIVGLGSVGSGIAKILSRMGMTKITLIDFDKVEEHNLDRLLGAYQEDIGKLKIYVIKRQLEKSSTANHIDIQITGKSLIKESAYRIALDCDVLFCCVDKPRPRYILNHIAFAHLIPVIDGGILIEFDKKRNLNFADWTVHTITPGKPCMQCLKTYYPSDVELERDGKLEDQKYLAGLPKNHHLKNRENVIPFSINLASMEVLHFIALTTDIVDADYYGEQRYIFKHGYLKRNYDINCSDSCDFNNNIGIGDTIFHVYDVDN